MSREIIDGVKKMISEKTQILLFEPQEQWKKDMESGLEYMKTSGLIEDYSVGPLQNNIGVVIFKPMSATKHTILNVEVKRTSVSFDEI